MLGRRLDSHAISLIGASELSELDTMSQLRPNTVAHPSGGYAVRPGTASVINESVHQHVGLHLFGPCHDPALQVYRVGKPGFLQRGQSLR
jgi:hypothetical protein